MRYIKIYLDQNLNVKTKEAVIVKVVAENKKQIVVDKPWGDYVPKDSNMSYEDVDMTETLVEIFTMKYHLQNNIRGVE